MLDLVAPEELILVWLQRVDQVVLTPSVVAERDRVAEDTLAHSYQVRTDLQAYEYEYTFIAYVSSRSVVHVPRKNYIVDILHVAY